MARKESQSHIENRPQGPFLVVGIDPSMTSTAVTIHVYPNGQNGGSEASLRRSEYLFIPSTATQAKAFLKGLEADVHSRKLNNQASLHCAVEALQIDTDVRIRRFNEMSAIVANFIAGIADFYGATSVYVSIEDYAMRANGMSYNIGEYGGILRSAVLKLPYHVIIRESDPLTIKLFAVKGDAKKPEMAKAYEDLCELGLETTTLSIEWFRIEHEAKAKAKAGKKQKQLEETSPVSDLIDSWWIAEVLRVELWVRWGWINHNKLDVRKLQVFNRTTSSYPVNVLNRSFLGK